MTVSEEFKDHVLDLLDPLGLVSARRLFGGVGLYYGPTMFGMIMGDGIYLKTDDENVAAFIAAGAGPFEYNKQGKTVALKSYFRLPEDVLDDPEDFVSWARGAADAALRAAQTKTPKKKKKKA